MKNSFATLFLIITNLCYSQSIVKEGLSFTSELMKRKVRYSIYLPDGYETSLRTYPVLYLLHGYTYDETSWIQFGKIQEITDHCIDENQLSKLIIVMPDGGTTWYQNDLAGNARYENFFTKEFIPYIEKTYSVKADKRFRAIAGFSMGGWGALLLSMKHTDLFSSAAGINAAIYTDEQLAEGSLDQKRFDEVFGSLYGRGLKGYQRINEAYRRNAPLHLLSDSGIAGLKTVRYYLDCADDDFLIAGNMKFHELMTLKKIPHEFRVRDGSHTWEYWRTAMPELLKFVEKEFIKD